MIPIIPTLQVTEGKAKIEKAMKLMKKLRKEQTAVQDFIARSNSELDIRERAQSPEHRHKDLTFAKVARLLFKLCTVQCGLGP